MEDFEDKITTLVQKLRSDWYDTYPDGALGLDDFIKVMKRDIHFSCADEDLERLFDIADTDRNGTIDISEVSFCGCWELTFMRVGVFVALGLCLYCIVGFCVLGC